LCGDFGFKSTMNAFNWLFLVVLQLNILASGALVILCFWEFFIVYHETLLYEHFLYKKSSLAFKFQGCLEFWCKIRNNLFCSLCCGTHITIAFLAVKLCVCVVLLDACPIWLACCSQLTLMRFGRTYLCLFRWCCVFSALFKFLLILLSCALFFVFWCL
jgi:hypothetical protein